MHLKNQGKNVMSGWQLCRLYYEIAKQTMIRIILQGLE